MERTLKAPLDAPVPPDWSVREGRDAYLAENGFLLSEYDAKRTPVQVLGFSFSVPNGPAHRRGIMQHDLHHVATGFGTDPIGEGEVSCWELRGALRGLGPYVRSLVTLGACVGAVLSPRRSLRAYRKARGAHNLFACGDEDYAGLLDLSVGELRQRLGIPPAGLASGRRGLHSGAPAP